MYEQGSRARKLLSSLCSFHPAPLYMKNLWWCLAISSLVPNHLLICCDNRLATSGDDGNVVSCGGMGIEINIASFSALRMGGRRVRAFLRIKRSSCVHLAGAGTIRKTYDGVVRETGMDIAP